MGPASPPWWPRSQALGAQSRGEAHQPLPSCAGRDRSAPCLVDVKHGEWASNEGGDCCFPPFHLCEGALWVESLREGVKLQPSGKVGWQRVPGVRPTGDLCVWRRGRGGAEGRRCQAQNHIRPLAVEGLCFYSEWHRKPLGVPSRGVTFSKDLTDPSFAVCPLDSLSMFSAVLLALTSALLLQSSHTILGRPGGVVM